MNIRTALNDATARLTASSSPRLDAEVLLACVLHCDRTSLFACPERDLAAAEADAFAALMAQREAGRPVAYLTGVREFMGLEFQTTADVLIPRPETELLVESVLKREKAGARTLELGTGSGCIGIALAKLGGLRVLAGEYSVAALHVAQVNARANGVAGEAAAPGRICFFAADWETCLRTLRPEEAFEVLVSNPPYVRDGEYNWLGRGVKCEPVVALLGGADGQTFYRRLCDNIPRLVRPGGRFYIEMGNNAEITRAMFEQAPGISAVDVFPDLAGWPRVLTGTCG